MSDLIARLRDRGKYGMNSHGSDMRLHMEAANRIELLEAQLAAAPAQPETWKVLPSPPTDLDIDSAIWHLKGTAADFDLARRLIRRVFSGELRAESTVDAGPVDIDVLCQHGLAVFSRNVLRGEGINVISQLLLLQDRDLLRIPRCGRRTMQNIRDALNHYRKEACTKPTGEPIQEAKEMK